MTVPREVSDEEIVDEWRAQGVPSQRALVNRYGIGFSRAKRLRAVLETIATDPDVDPAVAREAADTADRVSSHRNYSEAHSVRPPLQHRTDTTVQPPAVSGAHRTGAASAPNGAEPVEDGAARSGAEPVEETAHRSAPERTGDAAPSGAGPGEDGAPRTDASGAPARPGVADQPGVGGVSGEDLVASGDTVSSDQAPGDAAQESTDTGQDQAEVAGPEAPATVAPAEHHAEGEPSAPTFGERVGSGSPADAEPAEHGAPRTGEAPAGEATHRGAPGRTGDAAPSGAGPGEGGAPRTGAGGAAVRPGVAAVLLWALGAAGAAAVVVRLVQTPLGARVWDWLTGVVGAEAVTVAGAAAGAGMLAGAAGMAMHLVNRSRAAAVRGRRERRSGWSVRMYLAAAVVFMGLSVDTSLRFFHDKVGITAWWELALVFSGMELGLLACGVAMYEAVRDGRSVPHSARTVAWALAALAGTTGLLLGGWPGGLVRAAGPALAMVMLHMALGIERRRGPQPQSGGAVARAARELRERALSVLGLADEGRDAVARTRLRAARRAALLTHRTQARRRDTRLRRALSTADFGADEHARQAYLRELDILRSMESPETLRETVANMS